RAGQSGCTIAARVGMNLAGRFSLFVGAVLVAAGCSSSSSIRTVEPDGSLAPTSAFDAAGDPDRSRGTGGGTFGTDGPESPIVDSPPDAHRDGAREVPDGGDADAHIAGHACSAGHTCTGNVRCERVCIGPLIYRCSCTEGHFIC